MQKEKPTFLNNRKPVLLNAGFFYEIIFSNSNHRLLQSLICYFLLLVEENKIISLVRSVSLFTIKRKWRRFVF